MMRYSTFIKENFNIFLDIFDRMKTGIWISDGDGEVIIVNKESVKTGGLTREEVVGRRMSELIETGYITESATLKTIESKKEECVVEEMGAGGHCMVTSIPLFYEGTLDLVICVERNISEVERLKARLSEQVNIKNKLQKELLKLQNRKECEGKEFITQNINMLHLKELAVSIGKIDATVMITGESGTGKELVADLIHKNSKRSKAPFVKVNCAAIPETLVESEFFGYEEGAFTGASHNGKMGLFEIADGGTLFLDEIGELSLPIQSKLLRVLQEKEVRRIGGERAIHVDVRIIAATNKDLKRKIEEGTFRSDLYYRLFVVPVSIPPLRERRDDIELLAKYFLDLFNKEYDLNKVISSDALKMMEKYDWPGNVRELRNVVERLTASGAGTVISAFQVEMCLRDKNPIIPELMGDDSAIYLEDMVYAYEKEIIQYAYGKTGSVTAAAKMLHVDKSTVSRKMKKYGIHA